MSSTTLVIDHTSPIITSGGRKEVMRGIINALEGFTSGAKKGTGFSLFANDATSAAATGTITLATCAAGTEIEVNGVKFRAIASGTPTVSYGEFVISGTDAADATSLAAAINGSTDARIANVLTATTTGASGVVTVTVNANGAVGNSVTIKTNGVVAKGTATVVVALTDINDTISINGVAMTAVQQKATGTLTAATAIVGTTFVLDGVTFTGVAGAATSGAANFSIDTGDNETATSIAAQINAYAAFSGKLSATSASAVVTIRADTSGTAGNAITLLGTATVLAESALTLEGGVAVANNEFDFSPGSTATQVAADLVRCCNASTSALINQHVVATHLAGVVTFWALYPGTPGNHITLASNDADGLAVSAARLAGGTELSSGGAQAAAVITFANVANADTITIGGVVFTAHTDTEAADQFPINGTDTADAAYAAKMINATISGTLAKDIVATSSGAELTITARRGGVAGNAITVATSSGVTLAITGSASRLLLGAAPPTVVPSAARLASGVGGSVAEAVHTF